MTGILSQYKFVSDRCRDDDRKLEDRVRALIADEDIPALALRDNRPVAIALLLGSFKSHSRVVPLLHTAGAALPIRLIRSYGIGSQHKAYTKAGVVRLIRNAPRAINEAICGLLTGEGDPAAVLLRRLVEEIRGVPLEVFDLSAAAAIEPPDPEVERRSEWMKRAAVTRKARQEEAAELPKVKKRRLTAPAKRKANVIERQLTAAARKAERDAKRDRTRTYTREYMRKRLAERRKQQKAETEAARQAWEQSHAAADAQWRDKLARGDV